MNQTDARSILTPSQAYGRYHADLTVHLADGRIAVRPGVIGTVIFERGSKADVRQAILDCFDRFEHIFAEHLKGGKDSDQGKFTKRNPKGVEKIRRAILDTPPHAQVSAVRSSAVNEDEAAEYQIQVLTNQELPADYVYPGSTYVMPKGSDGGSLSYLKFQVPMHFVTTDDGLRQYEGFMRFVCERLPVRGGYGGYSSLLPYGFHRYLPQEWAFAERFSGLEIDSYGFVETENYVTRSYEGESAETAFDFFPYLRPGAKVQNYGFIKGVNWLTLLGDVFVDRLGGEAVIRAILARDDIGIERVNQCLLIRAGSFPRLGAPEEGRLEPYVYVNSVLRSLRNPKRGALHTFIPDLPHADKKISRLWVARFDLPGAAEVPAPPTVVPTVLVPDRIRPSVSGGKPCPEAGWWSTPASPDGRRYFEQGEIMPDVKGSEWGATYWHWSPDDGKPSYK
jgi:hypothetical protein